MPPSIGSTWQQSDEVVEVESVGNKLSPSNSSPLQRAFEHIESSGSIRWGSTIVCLALVLLRCYVGIHSYSGENTPPMFGDFEAQRHWMEITVNLPLSDWYFNTTDNDLRHWGIDYPPLSAYVSYVFGFLAKFVEPGLVELLSSRGHETATGKAFMRASVIVCDALVFAPAIYLMARALYPRSQQWLRRLAFVALVLSQPALLLIDHGHFQYNNVSLGFSALGVALILRDHEFLGSVAFSLALNFKQMSLYYAPAFGVYLLSRCLYRKNVVFHLMKLAVAVVGVFAVMWLPFCLFPHDGETCGSSVLQVLQRIFPVGRGLFEDKVANFWCIVDFVTKIRRHVDSNTQMRLCTILTVAGFAPSVIDLLRRKPTGLRFILSMAISSLSFYLFSFHVHEKTILLPMLPISFLLPFDPRLASWFSMLSTFSMYFLLKKDGLLVPYFVLQTLFACIVALPTMATGSSFLNPVGTSSAPMCTLPHSLQRLARTFSMMSIAGIVLIHIAQATIPLPARYPHIHDYVFAAYSCAHFLLTLAYLTYWQWTAPSEDAVLKPKAA